MVQARRLTVLEEPFSLDLPYPDRQRIVVMPNDVVAKERHERAQAKPESGSRTRRHAAALEGQAARDQSQNPPPSFDSEREGLGSAVAEQLRRGAAEYEAAVLRGWGKLHQTGTGVKERIAAKKSERATRRRLGALLISRAEAEMLRFDHGHPLESVLYVRHPAQPATYYPAAEFHRRVFEDKFVEAIKLLMSLGATRLAYGRVHQGRGKDRRRARW